MRKRIILALIILVLGAGVAFFVFKTEPKLNKNFETEKSFFKKFPFHMGLDLSGGIHLIYKADVSAVSSGDIGSSMDALRDVIERRMNIFGVSEPVIQVQHGGLIAGGGEQLIVDLPGVTDVKEAIKMIGQTPILEFKTEAPKDAPVEVKADPDGKIDLGSIDLSQKFMATELTGRYLQKATLEQDPNTRRWIVKLQFDAAGTAIYLDGVPVSTPVVREEIPNGEAVISGDFTSQEAKILVGRLNSGALPVPIT